ncbi:MAG: ABC transporter ATP-binding protein [Firmicutes bacterium]|nr:ABC transporter ATP-binding protein [Bacillota bacterium]
MHSDDVVIRVEDACKDFRIYKDKSHTFKDWILFKNRHNYTVNHVLSNVSLTVNRGQALGLIGHNGCGKSTTLKLLNKILYPDSGNIYMNGKISSLIELGAGFHPDMTGRENIYINASIFGLKKHEIDERLDDIIRFSELERFIDSPVRTYSSGMYMRLAFSIAINVNADILLVDEILAVGDANFQKKCFDKMKEIKSSGTTIVIVSHSMDQIKSICDRVIWLEEGKIREDGDAYQVCDDYLTAMDDAAKARMRKEQSEITNVVIQDPNIAYPISQITKQAGKNARRSGNMRARFSNIELDDPNGKPCRMFSFGDSCKVKFSITSQQPDLIGEIIFNIITKDGNWLTSLESYLNVNGYSNYSKITGGEVEIKNMPLSEGDYILEAVLRSPEGKDYDCLTHFIYFHVSAKNAYGSRPVAIENDWRLKGSI